jgi:hypothetical protein
MRTKGGVLVPQHVLKKALVGFVRPDGEAGKMYFRQTPDGKEYCVQDLVEFYEEHKDAVQGGETEGAEALEDCEEGHEQGSGQLEDAAESGSVDTRPVRE